MLTEKPATLVRKLVPPAILLILLGAGFAIGIVPGSTYMSNEERADQECQNCGVVETVKIAYLNDERHEPGDSTRDMAGNGSGDNLKQVAQFVVTVRMNNGERQTLAQASAPRFRSGQKVKIENNTLLAGYY